MKYYASIFGREQFVLVPILNMFFYIYMSLVIFKDTKRKAQNELRICLKVSKYREQQLKTCTPCLPITRKTK